MENVNIDFDPNGLQKTSLNSFSNFERKSVDGSFADWSNFAWIITDWTGSDCSSAMISYLSTLSSEEMVSLALKSSYIHTIQQVFLNLFKNRKEDEELSKLVEKRLREKKAFLQVQEMNKFFLKKL